MHHLFSEFDTPHANARVATPSTNRTVTQLCLHTAAMHTYPYPPLDSHATLGVPLSQMLNRVNSLSWSPALALPHNYDARGH